MAILTRDDLNIRLGKTDKDPGEKIMVAPLLEDKQIGEGSIDLRLGTFFWLFRQTELEKADSDVLSSESQMLRFMEPVRKGFGENFVLHPGQFALAGTFEYIVLPPDVAAYVTTRSRYGRIGLLIATATFVHPCWKGCLTLELENVGVVPIVLKCGSSIAHIIFHETKQPVKPKPEKGKPPVYPTRPSLKALSKTESKKLEEVFQKLYHRDQRTSL